MNRQVSRILPRCQHLTATGRQCRFSASHAHSKFCIRHALENQRNSDLTKLFTLAHDKYQSPAGIHASLAELFTLLAENRVAPRRAAVLAYISSLMLRTLPVIQEEVAAEQAAARNAPTKILWNIPRPAHERHGAVNPSAPPSTATPAEPQP